LNWLRIKHYSEADLHI